MFHIMPLLLWGFVVWRLSKVPGNTKIKAIIGFSLFLGAIYHLSARLFFGGMAAPNLPESVLMLGGVLFATLGGTGLTLLIFDFFRRLINYFRVPTLKSSLKEISLIFIVFLSAAGYGLSEALKTPELKEEQIIIGGLHPEADGLRVLQISDLHVSSLARSWYTTAVVNKAMSGQADLILLTGDMVDGSTERREADVEPLRRLSAPLGVFASEGNHEHYSGLEVWRSKLETLGIKVLRNQHIVIEKGEGKLVIGGVADRIAERFGAEKPNVQKTFEGAPGNVPKILMAHQPKGTDEMARQANVDLVLSGHTHGGHLPILKSIVSMANDGKVQGFYNLQKGKLYVSSGAGLWAGFPIRIGVPSEMTVFVLRAK